jgi:menaquinone reductase, multiheme cytochrome c subunit
MSESGKTTKFVFPRGANYLLPVLIVAAVGGALYVPVVVGLGGSPSTTAVGYAPEQPVPFSHLMHVGQLGLDCRYCHNTVEDAPFAAIPPTATCMNCHSNIKADSPQLARVIDSWQTGQAIEWLRVHDLPDHAYFNHAAHVQKGVGCVECHGRVDLMDVVQQVEPLSMAWCLECHRDPGPRLRPLDQVTNMAWLPPASAGDRRQLARDLTVHYQLRDINFMQSCSTCHR